MNDKKYFIISTLQRGLDVIEILAQKNSLTITELANELNINRVKCRVLPVQHLTTQDISVVPSAYRHWK
jgi:predicted transcriptional regulator